ncbi:MAG TPA: carboxypeptidase regulatory-like domain-containing protein, partial [Opitutaceae bacterium]|nr:carboxypeptidase regulatory-like domain-containing protein [Opitutaceae bacterium]
MVLLGVCAAIPIKAWAVPVDFNLAAQPTDTALLMFSKQAQAEVLFSSDALSRVRSPEVIGRFEPGDALNKLLEGTGFAVQRNWRGKFVVTTAKPAPGSIKGHLLTGDGFAARNVRVMIPDIQQSTTTSKTGEFVFGSVVPGTYRILAVGAGYQPLEITNVKVEPVRTLALETQTMQTASDLARLDAVVVEGRSTRPFGRGQSTL